MKAFPDLSDEDDLPDDTIAMHMTPDGSKWWLAGQEGEIREVKKRRVYEEWPGGGVGFRHAVCILPLIAPV